MRIYDKLKYSKSDYYYDTSLPEKYATAEDRAQPAKPEPPRYSKKLGKAELTPTGRSEGKPEGKGSSVAMVKAAVNSLTRKMDLKGLKIDVVKTQAEAERLAGESTGDTVHAMYLPDGRRIVLVADNLKPGEIREKLQHELIHHALENLISKEDYNAILEKVSDTRGSGNELLKKIWQQVDKNYPEAPEQVKAAEFLSHMSEKHQPGKFGMMWHRAVRFIRGILQKAGLLKENTGAEDLHKMREVLSSLGDRLKRGYDGKGAERSTEAAASKTRTVDKELFKADKYDANQFADDVKHVASLENDPKFDLNLGDTPQVLLNLGARNFQLVMPSFVVHKATRYKLREHRVSVDTIANLPDLLADPIAVLRSDSPANSRVVLIDALDTKNFPVIAAIHLDDPNSKFARVNKIASVYGKDSDTGEGIKDMIGNGLIYLNKDKAIARYHAERLQLPTSISSLLRDVGDKLLKVSKSDAANGSKRKILYPEDIRKVYYSKSSESSIAPEETRAEHYITLLQDKFRALKSVQDNIRKQGGHLNDANDAYLAEELSHGKAENDLTNMRKQYVEPLAKLLADYKITRDQLDEYLYARHAQERNAYIAKINDSMPDGGSGMTNAEARKILNTAGQYCSGQLTPSLAFFRY